MSLVIVIAALAFLMFAAYRGYSVILFAPLAALGAVLLVDPAAVAPVFSGIFMERLVGFVKLYFPVFLLGAVFGKVIELSGFSESIVAAAIKYIGRSRANAVIVTVCALLTYGGVSMFVVVFAVYPFAAELYRQSNIPKRLIPGAIALGGFSFTMDALPGTPQIQNIIPTTFFKTTAWAAPALGTIGAVFILIVGLTYLEWRRRAALKHGEGYGTSLVNEPEHVEAATLPHPALALAPLVLVGVANFALTKLIPQWYGTEHTVTPEVFPGITAPLNTPLKNVVAIWAVEGAMLLGILLVVLTAFKRVHQRFVAGSKAAVSGALLASLNTASEYGFGAVIAILPGFLVVSDALRRIPDPLVNAAITVSSLAGITGTASGGMSIALAAMSDTFIAAAHAAHIPLDVMHRVVAMASGGMDTLPHNGAVITLLAVTGLTHRESYRDIFAVTLIKTLAVFFVIAVFYVAHVVHAEVRAAKAAERLAAEAHALHVVKARVRPHEADVRRAVRVACANAIGALKRGRHVRVAIAERDCASVRTTSVVQLRIGGRHVQRTVRIRCTDAPCAVVRKLACRIAETIQAAELHAIIVRARVLDGVLDRERVVEIIVVERVAREVVAIPVASRRQRREIVDDRIVLTTQRQRTVLIAAQPDIGLPIEDRAAFSILPVIQVKAVLQLEDRVQASAEILIATQTEIGVRHRAARLLPIAVAELIIRIDESCIERAIKRHAALRVRRDGKCPAYCSGQ
ncbi:hypothetical protein DFQ28_003043 [Apophysomyces sp. BC1034]|nr:hypothetical protein DFQ28_003043 [Apophysomyces sp. BC1034]